MIILFFLAGLVKTIPDWIEWTAGIFALILGGGYVGRRLEVWFPSKREQIDWMRKNQSDFVKSYGEAVSVHEQLTTQIGRMVEARTEQLQGELTEVKRLYTDRELEHREEVNMYQDKALEIKKKLDEEIQIRLDCVSRLDALDREFKQFKLQIGKT
jgi:hypothetical protein